MDEVERLIEQLKDPDPATRWEAAERLGVFPGHAWIAKIVGSLIEALDDENWQVRNSAADSLASIRDVSAVEPLIDAMKDEVPTVRFTVAFALGRIGDARAVPVLIEAMNDEDANVRYKTAGALSKIDDIRVVGALIDALEDEDRSVRGGIPVLLQGVAESVDINLADARDSLCAVVDRVDAEKRESVKRLAAEAYAKMAKAVSDKKEKEMPGEMLPARIRKPKGKKIYRMRRVV